MKPQLLPATSQPENNPPYPPLRFGRQQAFLDVADLFRDRAREADADGPLPVLLLATLTCPHPANDLAVGRHGGVDLHGSAVFAVSTASLLVGALKKDKIMIKDRPPDWAA